MIERQKHFLESYIYSNSLNEEFTWRREPFLADQVERYIGPLFGELLRGVLERSHRLSLDLLGEG
jgi:hypothetical protein